jgi:anaerobic ribonucleoside-triphosphate reductase
MSKPTDFMLEDDFTSTVYKEDCYICRDPEFALCYRCKYCGGHVAADSTVCDECGNDQTEPPKRKLDFPPDIG